MLAQPGGGGGDAARSHRLFTGGLRKGNAHFDLAAFHGALLEQRVYLGGHIASSEEAKWLHDRGQTVASSTLTGFDRKVLLIFSLQMIALQRVCCMHLSYPPRLSHLPTDSLSFR